MAEGEASAGHVPGSQAWLQASGLPERWQGQRQHSVLLAPFGQGQHFLALLQAWKAWQAHAQHPAQLLVVGHALRRELPAPPPEPPESAEAAALRRAWPPATDNLHLLEFEGGSVRLLLLFGPAGGLGEDMASGPGLAAGAPALRQLRQLQADTLWAQASAADPKLLARLAAPGARLLLSDGNPALAAGLRAAGFAADPAGPPGLQAWQHAPRAPRRQAQAHQPPGQAVVVGAGIAGASAAAALARRGWQCTVLDARPQPAAGASGNPAALVHGTVHAADGTHARFNRAAALLAQRVYAGLLAQGVPGALTGLLRRESDWPSTLPPPGWAQAWHGSELRARHSGLKAEGAWFFPGAGWVDAAATVRALLATPGVRFVGQACAAALQRQGEDWCVLDTAGQPLASGRIVVLALAGGGDSPAPGLAQIIGQPGSLPWAMGRSRGQVSWFALSPEAHAQTTGAVKAAPAPLPWPVAGGGYALCRQWEDQPVLLCGATTQADDEDPAVRQEDHAFNLARLLAQTGIEAPAKAALHGRAGWREAVRDKLPLVGPVPDVEALAALAAQPGKRIPALAQLPRLPGLFMLGAMAGRGFTWGPLAGEVLASLVDGSAVPLEADLTDALDPARFWLRQQRRGAAT